MNKSIFKHIGLVSKRTPEAVQTLVAIVELLKGLNLEIILSLILLSYCRIITCLIFLKNSWEADVIWLLLLVAMEPS